MSTIAAIATATGTGSVGIIRMSGKDCFKVLEKIFIPKTFLLMRYQDIQSNMDILLIAKRKK